MSKRIVGVSGTVLAAAVLAGLTGCDTARPTAALPADAFVTNRAAGTPDVGQAIDHPGQVVYDAQHRPPVTPAGGADHISAVVREAVKPPGPEAIDSNTNGSDFPPAALEYQTPATQGSTGVSTGQFVWVGSVLAQVNGEPIFADKVLSTLERPLKAEAQADNEQHFRVVAEDLIDKQIREFIDNDLEYAAAKQALEKKDEQIARYVTGEWRKEQIRKAGGSEALARQRAAEEGVDFEELAQQQFRLNMTRLYYQDKILPLIQISAQDMRKYYQDNIRQFQQPTAAKFRVLFVSSDVAGGREQALAKAQRIYEQAKKGDDFSVMAADAKLNDDPVLARRGGAVGDEKGWMEKGAYATEKVEDAVWELHPGEVSVPIDFKDRGVSGFWVAKLEDIHNGQTVSFETEKVQDSIRETLRHDRFAQLREQHRRKLVEAAAIYQNPDVRQVTTEMVMQRYHVWTGK